MPTVKETCYLKNGTATFDSEGGKNPVLYVCGAVISDENAEKFGLPKKYGKLNDDAVAKAKEENAPATVAKANANATAK